MTDLERTEMEIVSLRHRMETVDNALNTLMPERSEAVASHSGAGIHSDHLCHKSSPQANVGRTAGIVEGDHGQ